MNGSRVVSVPIIGVGGIMNTEDAVSFLMAGASALQVGSATFVDPYAIPHIIEGIDRYLDGKGCTGVKEIIGVTRD